MLWPAPTPYPESVELPIPLRRLAYRCAYALLWAYRSVAKPALHGVKCVLVDSDRILLVRHTYGPNEWDFPGGGLKRNEAPLSAARREIRAARWFALDELPPNLAGHVAPILVHAGF